jgi:hypothetical protein
MLVRLRCNKPLYCMRMHRLRKSWVELCRLVHGKTRHLPVIQFDDDPGPIFSFGHVDRIKKAVCADLLDRFQHQSLLAVPIECEGFEVEVV